LTDTRIQTRTCATDSSHSSRNLPEALLHCRNRSKLKELIGNEH